MTIGSEGHTRHISYIFYMDSGPHGPAHIALPCGLKPAGGV